MRCFVCGDQLYIFPKEPTIQHVISNRTCILFFPAGISGRIFLYNRPGHDVFLSCDRASSMNTTCSNVTWLYNRDTTSETLSAVKNEDVDKSSARAARLSVGTDCSLLINHITAEDAGRYTCRQGGNTDLAYVHLSVLTSESHFHETSQSLSKGNSTFGWCCLGQKRCIVLNLIPAVNPVHYVFVSYLHPSFI